MDLEATCQEGEKPIRPQEIIEMSAVLVDEKAQFVDEIQIYIQPLHNPELTDFCINLTGITQLTVNQGCDWKTACSKLNQWIVDAGLYNPGNTFHVVTCGNWDCQTMIPKQCQLSGIRIPSYFKSWINIITKFKKLYRIKAGGLAGMMKYLNLEWIGRHHSGLDDSRNTAQIWAQIINNTSI